MGAWKRGRRSSFARTSPGLVAYRPLLSALGTEWVPWWTITTHTGTARREPGAAQSERACASPGQRRSCRPETSAPLQRVRRHEHLPVTSSVTWLGIALAWMVLQSACGGGAERGGQAGSKPTSAPSVVVATATARLTPESSPSQESQATSPEPRLPREEPPTATAAATRLTGDGARTPADPATGGPGVSVDPPAPTARGAKVTVSARTAPNILCFVVLVALGRAPAPPPGTAPTLSDAAGRVAWSWTIDPTQEPGNAEVRVSCGVATVVVPLLIR